MRILIAVLFLAAGCGIMDDCTPCGNGQCCDNQTQACVEFLGLPQCFGKADVELLKDGGR